MFNMIVTLEPVQRSEDRCDKRKLRNFNHSICKTVLNLLEAIYLRLIPMSDTQQSSATLSRNFVAQQSC